MPERMWSTRYKSLLYLDVQTNMYFWKMAYKIMQKILLCYIPDEVLICVIIILLKKMYKKEISICLKYSL